MERAPARRIRFTSKAIEALKPNAKGAFLVWDTETPGLACKVYPSGKRVFFALARVGGAQKKMAVEPFGLHSIEQVRTNARELLGRFASAKRDPKIADPLTEKRLAREGRARALSVSDLADIFEREHLPKRKPRTSEQFATLRRHFERELGALPVATIGYDAIATFHAKFGSKSRIQANRAVAALSAMFTLAQRKGLRSTGNPCKGIERFPEHVRTVRFSPTDLGAIGRALADAERDGSELASAIAAARLLLLTGARRDEILGARWSELDVAAGLLRIADHKTSRRRGAKYLVLGRAALAVLERLAAERDPSNDWIVPGRVGRLVGFARPWSRIMQRAGLADRRPHDARRTFASVATEIGYPEAIVGELLGHTPKTVTAGYILPGTNALRHAADAISGAVAAMLSGEQSDQTGKLFVFGARGGA